MPAENIIAIHETVRNSGSSSSVPSGMSPNRLTASQMTKATNPEARTTNIQPMFVTDHPRAESDAAESVSVLRNPQATKATAIAATTPKTTLSTVAPRAVCSTTSMPRTGCGASSATGVRTPSSTVAVEWARGWCGCLCSRSWCVPRGCRDPPFSLCSGVLGQVNLSTTPPMTCSFKLAAAARLAWVEPR